MYFDFIFNKNQMGGTTVKTKNELDASARATRSVVSCSRRIDCGVSKMIFELPAVVALPEKFL
jgi:hypothetical protein